MNIDLYNVHDITDEFTNTHTINDVYMFSYASYGAQGDEGIFEAVVKDTDNQISLYRGDNLFNINIDRLDNEKWNWFNLGLGNNLFVRNTFTSIFKQRYTAFIELPYILYVNWKAFTTYYLNWYFNNVDDKELLNDANTQLKQVCADFDIEIPSDVFNIDITKEDKIELQIDTLDKYIEKVRESLIKNNNCSEEEADKYIEEYKDDLEDFYKDGWTPEAVSLSMIMRYI